MKWQVAPTSPDLFAFPRIGATSPIVQRFPMMFEPSPLTSRQVDDAEAVLHFELPEEYKRYLLESNGGFPGCSAIAISVGSEMKWLMQIRLYPLIDTGTTTGPSIIGQLQEAFGPWIPMDTLIIGGAAANHELLLYCDGPRSGEVWVKSMNEVAGHAGERQAGLHFCAKSFSEFLSRLTALPPGDVDFL